MLLFDSFSAKHDVEHDPRQREGDLASAARQVLERHGLNPIKRLLRKEPRGSEAREERILIERRKRRTLFVPSRVEGPGACPFAGSPASTPRTWTNAHGDRCVQSCSTQRSGPATPCSVLDTISIPRSPLCPSFPLRRGVLREVRARADYEIGLALVCAPP